MEPYDFILGLDIGNSTSAAAYIGANSDSPALIDVSGGYGLPVMPTAFTFMPDTCEWIFGDFAEHSNGLFLNDIVAKLGAFKYIQGGKIKNAEALGYFIKNLTGYCKNINPKAEIIGLVVCVPDFCTEQFKDELTLAINHAGLGDKFLGFAAQSLCVLTAATEEDNLSGLLALLDFGAGSLRGGIYEIDKTEATALKYMQDTYLGFSRLDETATDYFRKIFEASGSHMQNTEQELARFSAAHKNTLWFKEQLKVYFNRANPPFAKKISKHDTDALKAPYVSGMQNFLQRLAPDPSKIDKVIFAGGGFELPFIQAVAINYFQSSKIYKKNAATNAAHGAALLAANMLGLKHIPLFTIEENKKLTCDIGVKATTENGEAFVPIAMQGEIWQNNIFTLRILPGAEKSLDIYMREKDASPVKVAEFDLSHLPERKKHTGFCRIELRFLNASDFTVETIDEGFGLL